VLDQLGLKEGAGLWVEDVEPAGPADRVGVRRGDILRQLGQHTVDSVETLGQVLEDAEAGEVLLIGVLRVDQRWMHIAHGRVVVR
jgi:S1-C subfamily serine protease